MDDCGVKMGAERAGDVISVVTEPRLLRPGELPLKCGLDDQVLDGLELSYWIP